MKKTSKKLLSIHKKVLETIKTSNNIYEVCDQFGITEDDIKFWRKTITNFNEFYLKAIGLTRDQERFVELYPKKFFNVSATCRSVNIHRSTYYEWLDKSDTFKRFLHEATEGMKDDVETLIFQKIIIDKDSRALYMFARAKMKDRGYGDNSIY
jgi:hypothetical protein